MMTFPANGASSTISIRGNLRGTFRGPDQATLHSHCNVSTLVEGLNGDNPAPSTSAWIVYAAVQALHDYPEMNARIVGSDLVRYRDVRLGVLIDTDQGILTACIPEVQNKTVQEIAACMRDLKKRARRQRLKRRELQRATFTMIDLSTSAVETFTPVLRSAAIVNLGIGRVRRFYRPLGNGGKGSSISQGRLTPILPLSLTFDCRGTNGLRAGRFLTSIVNRMSHVKAHSVPVG